MMPVKSLTLLKAAIAVAKPLKDQRSAEKGMAAARYNTGAVLMHARGHEQGCVRAQQHPPMAHQMQKAVLMKKNMKNPHIPRVLSSRAALYRRRYHRYMPRGTPVIQ
jgi:hypothetical protein